MMFSGTSIKYSDDEDDFFGTNKSNLANIFGVPMEEPTPENQTLKYVPPKQKRGPDKPPQAEPNNSSAKSSEWNVSVAKVVSAFKLVDKENISQGKIGMALLKHSESDALKLILYRTKQNILSSTEITSTFHIYLKSAYFQFSDSANAFWSLLFENDTDKSMILSLIGSRCLITQETVSDLPESVPPKEAMDNAGDQLPQFSQTKASILSRMAKMGQQLPILPAVQSTTEASDSSDGDARSLSPSSAAAVASAAASGHSKPTITPRKHFQPPKVTTIVPFSVPLPPAIQMSQPYSDPSLNVFLSETRSSNCELRMNMSRLESKIERVLDKMDILNISNNNQSNMSRFQNSEEEMLALESRLLDLKKENCALRSRCAEYESQRLDENQNSNQQLSDLLDHVSAGEKCNEEQKAIVANLTSAVARLEVELDSATQSCASLESKLANAESLLQLYSPPEVVEAIRTEQEALIQSLTEQLVDARKMAMPQEEPPRVEAAVKEIMNNLYQTLRAQFSGRTDDVMSIIAATIKRETNRTLASKSN